MRAFRSPMPAVQHQVQGDDLHLGWGVGGPVPDLPTVDPAHLADRLWTMHNTTGRPETTYPDGLLAE